MLVDPVAVVLFIPPPPKSCPTRLITVEWLLFSDRSLIPNLKIGIVGFRLGKSLRRQLRIYRRKDLLLLVWRVP